MSTDQIRQAALALPARSKAKLAEQLLHSIALPEQKRIDSAWADEIEDRIDAFESGKLKAIPSTQVIAKLKARKR
jgi:putative addiction module component (TIGR02574 family)